MMDRRRFLVAGGSSLLAAVVLGACTDDSAPPAQPGVPTTTRPTGPGAGPTDLSLTRTLASLEVLLVAVHQHLVSSPLVADDTVRSYANTFIVHHTQHLAALNGVITTPSGQAVTAPNDALDKSIVQPAFTAAQTQDDLVRLVFTLEDAIAQTYAYAAGATARPDLRSSLMTMSGVEARHRVLLGTRLTEIRVEDLFPAAFARTANPLPPDALLS